jgi:tellurite resistance protein TehA-like permease
MKIMEIVRAGVRDLFPGYPALVMATGIVSIAAYLLGWHPIGLALFYANLVFYALLAVLILWRLFAFPSRLIGDLTAHARGAGFLTIVAGTSILGSQFVLLRGDLAAGSYLWLLGAILWLLLIYAFFMAVITKSPKPDLEHDLNGGWLVIVVSTQSLAILGSLAASYGVLPSHLILFLALAMYLLGSALYLLIISLVFYRLIFVTLTPQEFAPDYWINMGAIAITTLAGATLMQHTLGWGFMAGMLPFMRGFTLFFWVLATWWIPLLTILEIWRHDWRHYPIRYEPRYWDIVFPLGMYTTCTLQLAQALDLPSLAIIPSYFIYVALLSWVLVFIGMFWHLRGTFVADRG